MIRQLLKSDYCLACQGCCRFSQERSVWSVRLLDEEGAGLAAGKENAGLILADKRLKLKPGPEGQGFICPFLNQATNRCGIYDKRPFECRLYPFVINRQDEKVYLALHPACPFIKEHFHGALKDEYLNYLKEYFIRPRNRRILENNPHLIQSYDNVTNLFELDIG